MKSLNNRRADPQTGGTVSPEKSRRQTAEYLSVEKIEHGVIYTKDHRYVKILELDPVNFLSRPRGRGMLFGDVGE